MEKNIFTFYRPKILAGAASLWFVLLYIAHVYLGLALLIAGLVMIFPLIVNRNLWNRHPFNLLFWTDDFSGVYKGILTCEYRNKNGLLQTKQSKHIKIISQTGNQISIYGFIKREDGSISQISFSKNIQVEYLKDKKQFKFISRCKFLEDPIENKIFQDAIEILNFNKDKKLLSGDYFSEKETPFTKIQYRNLRWIQKNNFEF